METEDTAAETDPGYVDMPIGEDEEPIAKVTSLEELLAGSAAETVNVMAACTKEELTNLGSKTHRQVERDWKSGEKWRKRHANVLKLYFGDLPPLPNGEELANAQVHYPIVATAVIRIAARIYDQSFQSNGEYFGCKPTDADDVERTIRVAKFMNWQVDHKIENYVENHDVLIVQVVLYGSGFTMLSYDHVNKCPKHDVIATEDMILPYKRKSTSPNLSDMPRITRVLRKYRYELEELADDGYYDAEAVEELYEDEDERGSRSSIETTDNEPIQKAVDHDSGYEKPEDDPDAPRVLYEMHTRYKFKEEKRGRPVIITIDKQTKRVLCIKIREDEDPEDRARYNREVEANQAQYEAAMQQFQVDMAQYVMNGGGSNPAPPMTNAMGPGMADGSTFSVGDRVKVRPRMAHDKMTENVPGTIKIVDGAAIGVLFDGMAKVHKWYVGEELEPAGDNTGLPAQGATDVAVPMGATVDPNMPQPPPVPPEPAPPRMVPIHHFYHYKCLQNPEGVYGNGFGMLLEGHNMFADTIGAYTVNAGTLATTSGGFISRQLRSVRGEVKFEPGVFKETDAVGKLSDMILPIKFDSPDPSMWKLIEGSMRAGDDISSAGDILSGETGGSNETATTTQIRIAQAMTNIAIVYKRITRVRTAEAKGIARINSVHLSGPQYFAVVDPIKQVPGQAPIVEMTKVTRADFLEDTDITVTADPRMASQQQRMGEAMQAVNVVAQMPPLQQNVPLMQAIARKVFMAMDSPDLVAAMMAGFAMPPPVTQGGMPMGGQPGGAPPPEGGPPKPEDVPPPVPGTNQPPNGGQTA